MDEQKCNRIITLEVRHRRREIEVWNLGRWAGGNRGLLGGDAAHKSEDEKKMIETHSENVEVCPLLFMGFSGPSPGRYLDKCLVQQSKVSKKPHNISKKIFFVSFGCSLFAPMDKGRYSKDLKSFGHHVRVLRVKAGLTQATLADNAGIGVVQVVRIENGSTSPGLRTLIGIADSLGVTLSELVNFERDSGRIM